MHQAVESARKVTALIGVMEIAIGIELRIHVSMEKEVVRI